MTIRNTFKAMSLLAGVAGLAVFGAAMGVLAAGLVAQALWA